MHYPNLTIQGFRGIKNLTIPQLGRVTLITGKNNTGKSSILEALHLHAQNAAPSAIEEILFFREEMTLPTPVGRLSAERSVAYEITSLFHGYPSLSDDFRRVFISTSGANTPMKLTMSINWFTESLDNSGNVRLDNPAPRLFWGDSADVPVLQVETELGARTHRLDEWPGYRSRIRTRRDQIFRARMPLGMVSSGFSDRTDLLGTLWDQITLTDVEDDVVDMLRLFDPNISDFSMVSGDVPGERVGMVRAKNISHPVPLRSFGDGMNRLFSIALSLVCASGGILLVDEFENGLHYSVQLDAWLRIFRLARHLDVQVFATTHSNDTISAFQEVAASTQDEGVLIRLNRRGDDIIPTVYSEDELAIADRHAIEIR